VKGLKREHRFRAVGRPEEKIRLLAHLTTDGVSGTRIYIHSSSPAAIVTPYDDSTGGTHAIITKRTSDKDKVLFLEAVPPDAGFLPPFLVFGAVAPAVAGAPQRERRETARGVISDSRCSSANEAFIL